VTTPGRRGAAPSAQQTPAQYRANGRSAVAEPALAGQAGAERIAVAQAPAGTGGSPGAPYLRARMPLRYYPLLWQPREYQ